MPLAGCASDGFLLRPDPRAAFIPTSSHRLLRDLLAWAEISIENAVPPYPIGRFGVVDTIQGREDGYLMPRRPGSLRSSGSKRDPGWVAVVLGVCPGEASERDRAGLILQAGCGYRRFQGNVPVK